MRRFGFTRWEVEATNALLTDGLGGDIPVLPAIIVTNRRTQKRVGYILKPQFRSRDLETLRKFIGYF